jgi:hypothetical protein
MHHNQVQSTIDPNTSPALLACRKDVNRHWLTGLEHQRGIPPKRRKFTQSSLFEIASLNC